MDAPVSSRSLEEYFILRESGTQALETTGGLGSPSTHLEQTFWKGLLKAEEGTEMGILSAPLQ